MASKDDVQVEALMAALDHPLKPEIEALRTTIKSAAPELGERVKWNAPSYYLGPHDMAAFNLRQSSFVQLVLVFPGGLMIEDRRGLLEGDYKDRRLLRVDSMADVEHKRPAIEAVVRQWVALVSALP
ncbi:hypothetical protein ASC89_11355 [Devosia sp. Root413D1]|uniref:DUF1801 domain-containing protein n=1 Tax=Devosia sp. Root413D1 TaxID=1736531 RepID=UPI0006F6BB47|nr:DUF1801 domain-containing protein [Devosia sp. Root413D1]KQW80638.1 hypothetical protein ASC89_11355 [Devosia sp. Root413D1]